MTLGLFALSLLFSILLCVHCVRTGREMYWLMIILMFQPLGGLVYAIVHVMPDIFGGSTARKLGKAARETMDPTREYREARIAADDAPTVRNLSRLAHAAAGLGKYDEAERLYADAAHGIHADDPALLLGRANALLELGRGAEALEVLHRLSADPEGHTPNATLALGRAYEAVGQDIEAERYLRNASERVPGFEGMARYAAFLARTGRRREAGDIVADLDRRMTRLRGQFLKEARHWRDVAARAAGV